MTINIKDYVQKENRLFKSVSLKPIKYQKPKHPTFKSDRLLVETAFNILWEYLLYQKSYLNTFNIEQFQTIMSSSDLKVIENKQALPIKLFYMLAQSHSDIHLLKHLRNPQYRGFQNFQQDRKVLENQIKNFLSHIHSGDNIIYKPRFTYEPLSLKGYADFIMNDVLWVFNFTLETEVSPTLHKELIMATLINKTRQVQALKFYTFNQWGIYNPLLNTYEVLDTKIPKEIIAVWETMIL